MDQPIRVLIAERDSLFRRGLVSSLATVDDFAIVGELQNVEDAYRQADKESPDVALIGTTVPGAPGIEFADEMRRRYPAVATIVLAERENDDELFAAIRAGAAAYCGRDIEEEDLHELIRRAADGEYVINEQLLSKPKVADRVLEQFRGTLSQEPQVRNAFVPLTDREMGILKKISSGMTNAQIGQSLGISPQTVKNHVTSILRKLAVNDRTQAVVTALKQGWLSIDDVDDIDPRHRPKGGSDT